MFDIKLYTKTYILRGGYVEKVILHSDLNNFYASVECLYDSSLKNKPLAVCGEQEKRHGIVLAKNNIAKTFGIKTGDTTWEAKRKCPDIVLVPPKFERYLKFSRLVKEIYKDYTDQVESFGLDECWLDVSGSTSLFGSGKEIADKIRKRIKKELDLTVSVGVSFNKAFAKLGSDMKKPDATTEISKENFKNLVWSLPANELLYVGPATYKKLKKNYIFTIGDIAKATPVFLKNLLGVNGVMLWKYANGLDASTVSKHSEQRDVKSIGNSTTLPYDVKTENDIKITMYILSESVAERLRTLGLKCSGVQISLKDKDLFSFERQDRLSFPSCCSKDIFEKSFEIYKKTSNNAPLRSIGVRAINLSDGSNIQLSYFNNYVESEKYEKAEYSIDKIRESLGITAFNVLLCSQILKSQILIQNQNKQ